MPRRPSLRAGRPDPRSLLPGSVVSRFLLVPPPGAGDDDAMGTTWPFVLVFVLASTVACLSPGAGADDDDATPFDKQGFLGLMLRDLGDGRTVVGRVLPGPLEGRGFTSDVLDIVRGDLVVDVDGRPMNAEAFRDHVRGAAPGASIRIAYRRSRQPGRDVPGDGEYETAVSEIVVTTASRDRWTGTIGRARSIDRAVSFDGAALLDPADPANVVGEAIATHELGKPLDTLLGVFRTWLDERPDYHGLSRVRAPFHQPFRMPELAVVITGPLQLAPAQPLATAVRAARDNLDVPVRAPAAVEATRDPGPIPAALHTALRTMAAEARAALGPHWQDEAFARKCVELLRVPRRTFYLEGPEAAPSLEVIRASMGVDFARLVAALAAAEPIVALVAADLPGVAAAAPPAGLAGAVSGDVLAAVDLGPDVGWVVIGGPGDNRYDMSRIGAVIDAGGRDAYHASGLRLGVRVIVDLAGDDVYTGVTDQGPGGAMLGICLIDDRAGHDRYEGGLISAGAACFGVSLLLDRAGNDVYAGTEWSLGAACYGAGIILDLGGGSDVYRGEFLCQGVGGPRGFGCIVDEGGRDLYRTNGPQPSAYGTPAVHQSFSQGIGFGYRFYAAGGIGVISDLGGDDRYEAGEFAQGGAYYFGLGVLHDASGRDLYYGNRYGQGFGVHQAHGILADDGGDDVYWSMTAASQGAGWDIGAGLLLDRGGNDTYRCEGLGQGAASQQAIGMLVDLGGDDRYHAGGGATQGQSGGNAYHYGTTGAFSFSLLLDLGGGADDYSRTRANDHVTVTGAMNDDKPEASDLHGLAIDR